MLRIKFICTLLLGVIVCSSPAVGQKKKKFKDKRFEPVVQANLKDYAGTYIGIEDDYVLEIEVTPAGQLTVRGLENGHGISLTNVRVMGARLTADKVYEDGRREAFAGTFSNRILNGVSAFGIVVEDLSLDGGGVTLSRVFYRRS